MHADTIAVLPVGFYGRSALIYMVIIPDSDIGLLCSKQGLKALRGKIDFGTDTLGLFGDSHRLSEQKDGHYVVPLLSFPPDGWSDPRSSPEREHLILRVVSEGSAGTTSTSAQAESTQRSIGSHL